MKPWPSNFVAKGSCSVEKKKRKKEKRGGEAIEKKLRVDATMAFCQTNTTPSGKRYLESPTSSPLHPPSKRMTTTPSPALVRMGGCIRHAYKFFLLPPTRCFSSVFLFFFSSSPIIVHLGQPFRRQFRLFFKDVHHFSGRVKSHSTTRTLLCRLSRVKG